MRYCVLISAIAMFVLSAGLLLASQRGARAPFTSWYALALLLLAVGLFGVMIQLSLGCVVNWLGRTAQWLGGLYLLLAAVAASRQSDLPLFPLEDESRPDRYRYAVAIAIVFAAAALRLAFLSTLGTHNVFVTFYPAVMLAALYGGLRAGLLAIVLSALIVDYFWMEPLGQFAIGSPGDLLSLVIFVLGGLMIAWISEAMHRARARASAAETQALLAAERVAAAETLRESEEHYRSLFDNMLNGYAYCKMLFDENGPKDFIYLNVNGAFEALTGLKNVIGKNVSEVIPGIHQSDPELFEIYGRVALTGTPERFETYVAALGMWFSISVYRPRREHFVAVFDVITERKKIEEELRKQREWLRVTLSSIGDAVIATDVAGRITFMNSASEELTGWTFEEASSMPVTNVFNIINEHTRDEVESPVAKVLREGTVVGLANHTILVKKDGTEVPIDDSGAPIRDADGNTIGVVLVFRDIIERKKAEEQAASDKYLQQLLLDHFPGVALLLRTTTREIVASNQAGIDVGAVRGAKCFDTWGQNPDPCPWCLAPDLWETGKEQHVVLDAGDRVMEAHWAPVADDLYMHYALDITEHKRAEEKLRGQERVIQQALGISNSFAFDWDTATDRVRRSDSCKKIFGIDHDEMCNATSERYCQSVHPDDLPLFGKLLRNLTPAADTYVTDYRLVRSDGSVVTLEETAQGFFDAAGKIIRVIGVATDVTERKQMEEELRKSRDQLELRVQERTNQLQREMNERSKAEEQLRQAQKMEALGTMSGGIAHDFNNILAAIIGFSELLEGHVAKGSRDARHLGRIMEAGIRGRELVRQMLAFARKVEQEKKPLPVSTIVKESVKLLRATTPSTINIRVNASSEALILGDPIQIQQVLMNLCTNATYAMREKGGSLDIELSDYSVSPSNGDPHGIAPGHYVKLTVRDRGTGISSDIMDKIFDPFFTTKKVGEGTGLGLSVVHGIVKQHDGHITVESEPGRGSTFTIYFPQIAGELEADAPSDDEIPTGSERILFVDDEEMLVDMGEDILAELGYDVTSRMSSREALALFRLDPSRFDLVITDQTMPEMTGVELAKEVLAIRADMPIIMCTGFSYVVDADKAKAAGIKAFAMKPLTKKEIAKTIRKVLDG